MGAREAASHEPSPSVADAELFQARHDVLTTRDHIIGLEAENARLRKELGKAEWNVRRLRKRKRLQNKEIQRLNQALKTRREQVADLRLQLATARRRADAGALEVAALKQSRTWRVGRFFAAPLRVFKR